MAAQSAKRSAGKKAKAKSKKPTVKKNLPAPVPPKAVVYAPLPNVVQLTKQAAWLLWNNKAVLGVITFIYGLLSLILVRGLEAGVDVAQLRDEFGSRAVGSLAAYAQLLGDSAGGNNPGGSAYQIVLFIVTSLALIWALRRIVAGKRATVSGAFYRGMTPFVPFTLLLGLIGLQLLPALIGVSVYQLVVLTGIAATTFEVVIWGALALVLALASVYFLVSSVMALYVVSLPGVAPMAALRATRRLLRGRRWTVLRKVLFLPLVLLISVGVIMVPFILLLPVVAGWLLFALGMVCVTAAHAYLYSLYQRLLDEQ